ncbi:MAG TPA: phytanoyl-CoA dioxygenase family protein, partial [Spongiibacteraceae bacterium]|nr:phytanoyl-CoA dioxygenase family protein [Spongiibacteraceae bacterium]
MSAAEIDCYPSRTGDVERILARRDPVIHSSRPAPVDAELASRYERDGFIVLENIFTLQEIESFQREAERLRGEWKSAQRDEVIIEPQSRDVRSIFDVPAFSELFARVLSDSRLLDWARYLLDDDVYVHQSRLNYKPAFEGKEFYWHSDFETWHVED